ncbi:MAG: TVP38/TMEM64 family protein [Acutalibacteraceae bacterium]
MNIFDKIKEIKIFSDDAKQKKKQVSIIIALAVLLVAFVVCYCFFGKKLLAFFEDTDRFKAWLDSFGTAGKVIFVTIRALQTVVKFIPAEPLEIGSGYAYGTFGGLFFCSLGTLIGSFIIIGLTKIFGVRIVNVFVSQEKINSLRFLQNKSKLSITLLIIYLIPGTPKDVITYLIGITDYSIWKFLLITTFARIPSIITSTICGSTLEQKRYWVSALVFISTAILGLVGLFVYNKYQEKLNKQADVIKDKAS